MILYDYSYWIKHIENFEEHFGEKLEINFCRLEISDSYTKTSPEIRFGTILMPSQYLDLLNVQCNLILCNRNLFQHIGDYNNEDLNRQNFEIPDYTLSPESFQFKYLPQTIHDKVPQDQRRRKAAALLRDMITCFALYHELGHARQNGYVQEITYQDKQDENWENQVAEVDADIFAINWLWRTVLSNYHNFKPSEAINSKRELVELGVYSTFLFFVLSNNSDALINPYGTHPHPIIRFEVTTIFLKRILEDNILSKVEFERVIQSVIPEFLKTLTYHFGSINSFEYREKFKSPEVNEMKIIIQYHLERIPFLNRNRPYDIE